MSEGHVPGRVEEPAGAPELEQATNGASPVGEPQQPAARRRPQIWPIVVVGLIIIGIVLSPFWAPALAPLLPWGAPAASVPDFGEFAARLEAVEQRPAAPAADVTAITSVQSALAGRVDRLETERAEDRQSEAAAASLKGVVQRLEQQLGTIEARAASREAADAAATQKVQQELTRLSAVAGDLASRLAALEQPARAERTLSTDVTLLVALLQIREAVDRARPFAAELSVFRALAHDRPDLVAATEPLTEAARDGVPGRFALANHLAEVAGRIASVQPPPPEGDWEARVLARLRGLVTIRRIEGAPLSEPEAAVHAAEVALARGDLGEAVAQLDRLSGASAQAASPWLRMARRQLAAEGALEHLQELLVTGLVHPAEAPPATPGGAAVKPEKPQ